MCHMKKKKILRKRLVGVTAIEIFMQTKKGENTSHRKDFIHTVSIIHMDDIESSSQTITKVCSDNIIKIEIWKTEHRRR